MGFMYEEITKKIIGICFDVSNELGSGFLESVYENSLYLALKSAGLQVRRQEKIDVYFRDQLVGTFYADLLVENKVLIELKAVEHLVPEHKAQVINYLKATGIKVGLLINFGKPKLEYKRLYIE